MKARVEIPVEWCSDKDIVFGYLSFEAARAISESDLPENYQIDLFANRGSLPTGKTSAPAAAVRAKFLEEIMAQAIKTL